MAETQLKSRKILQLGYIIKYLNIIYFAKRKARADLRRVFIYRHANISSPPFCDFCPRNKALTKLTAAPIT